MIQRRLAWPLRKDDTHKSRNGPNFYSFFFCFEIHRWDQGDVSEIRFRLLLGMPLYECRRHHDGSGGISAVTWEVVDKLQTIPFSEVFTNGGSSTDICTGFADEIAICTGQKYIFGNHYIVVPCKDEITFEVCMNADTMMDHVGILHW
ncbi:hypothetical protein OROHE_005319 [Orobanche hederae]